MAKPMIEVRNLSKVYQLGSIGARSLRDELERLWHRVRRGGGAEKGLDAGSQPPNSDFWALRDVSFEVQPGEVVGIIGRNGAGKSTLLKILSRITQQTTGEITLRGRVASLLEVGTGFHPDLTGRENIFLNGAILGMTKAEIRGKMDEIIAFAEVEKFIDTPVKRYSSGMYVRLAFAVAAHLEPEILIVDEVLAVGDQQFQKKCLGRMQNIASNDGRTILFVSHNMNAVESLCSRAILLKDGAVASHGSDIATTIRDYLADSQDAQSTVEWKNPGNAWENNWFKVERFSLRDAGGRLVQLPVRNDGEVWVEIEGVVRKADTGLQIGYGMFHAGGSMLFWSTNRDIAEVDWQELRPGPCVLRSRIPPRFLNEGSYKIDLFLGLYHRQWICEPGVMGPGLNLDIAGGLSDSPYWVEARPGLLGPVFPWQVSKS